MQKEPMSEAEPDPPLFTSPGDARVRREYGALARRQRSLRRRLGALLTVVLFGLGIVVAGNASAHSADLSALCNSATGKVDYTLDNSNSNGTLTIVSQVGGVFTAGAVLQPTGQPGHSLTVPGPSGIVVSVHVTWSTDNRLPTGALIGPIGPEPNCGGPTTTPSTAPPTTPSTAPPTTPSTAPPTTPSTAPPTTPSTAPPTTPSTAPPTTPTTGNPCDHRTPEETLPPECFPPTTPAPPTTVTVCGEGLTAVTNDQGTVTCTPTLIPPASTVAPPVAATPSFTG